MALAYPGLVATSTDGIFWERVTVSIPSVALGYGNGYFLLANSYGIATSKNGKDWTPVGVSTPFGALNIGFNNATFLAVGNYGSIFQSDPVVRIQLQYDSLPHLTVEGPRNARYRIEALDSLGITNSWQALTTISTPPESWSDPNSSGGSNRMYRAVLLPFSLRLKEGGAREMNLLVLTNRSIATSAAFASAAV